VEKVRLFLARREARAAGRRRAALAEVPPFAVAPASAIIMVQHLVGNLFSGAFATPALPSLSLGGVSASVVDGKPAWTAPSCAPLPNQTHLVSWGVLHRCQGQG
jgi:hypothetical protein